MHLTYKNVSRETLQLKSPLHKRRGDFCVLDKYLVEILVFIIGAIHLDWLRIIADAPYAARADTSANATANAPIWIGFVAPRAILMLNTSNRFFWARFQAHLAVTACAAAYTAYKVLSWLTQIAMMTFCEISL